MRHFITGAGSGIGAALATILSARGDELILAARNGSRAQDLASAFPSAEVVVAELGDPGTLNGLGREVTGPLDSLVHVAGVVSLGSVAQLRIHEWEQQLAVNLLAPAVLTRELLPALRVGRGSVICVNSTAGLATNPQWSAYAASKAGLRSFADALRAEEPEIRVTTVFPSRTATPMQEAIHQAEGKEYVGESFMSAEAVAASIVHVIDLPANTSIPEIVMRTHAGASSGSAVRLDSGRAR